MFAAHLARWTLRPEGPPIHTHSSDLLPVRCADGSPAMLKLARAEGERRGAAVLKYWDGEGAVRVLAHAGEAVLLERAMGPRSLTAMARGGDDDAATRILVRAAAALHRPRGGPLPELLPLAAYFAALWPAAGRYGGVFVRAAEVGRALFASPRDAAVLHGDLHHDNVLDGGARGWLAIDPKWVHGETGFDYANILCNPEDATALAPGRFARQLAVLAEEAPLERSRLCAWVLAYAGLSAAWYLDDGDDAGARHPRVIAELAAAELPPGVALSG